MLAIDRANSLHPELAPLHVPDLFFAYEAPEIKVLRSPKPGLPSCIFLTVLCTFYTFTKNLFKLHWKILLDNRMLTNMTTFLQQCLLKVCYLLNTHKPFLNLIYHDTLRKKNYISY